MRPLTNGMIGAIARLTDCCYLHRHERRKYCDARCYAVCVSTALVSALKVMRCIQCSLPVVVVVVVVIVMSPSGNAYMGRQMPQREKEFQQIRVVSKHDVGGYAKTS